MLPVRSAARADDLRPDFPEADLVVADLADPGSVPAVATAAGERVDGVVHAAGVVSLGPVAELDAEAWRSQLDVNLVAPALLTRALLPALRAARGTVVLVNSGAGQVAHPTWAAYAASKHGLKALADSLRAEEAEHGVRVTSVYPGRTATAMQERVHAQEGKDYDAGPVDPSGDGVRRDPRGARPRGGRVRPGPLDQAALRAQPTGSSTKTRIRRRSPTRCR